MNASAPTLIRREKVGSAQAVDHVQVAVADAPCDSADQHLPTPWFVHLHLLDGQRFVNLAKHGC